MAISCLVVFEERNIPSESQGTTDSNDTNSLISLNDLHLHLLYVKLLSTLLVLFTTSAVPRLPWKEELTNLTFEVFKSRAELPAGSVLY